MDQRKIIIINLSKGRIGDENMKLLGGLLVTKIYLAAMSRADVPDRAMKMIPNFYLFVDEFQNFANASFADILSEARKYKLNLTIAHQYIEQMDEVVRPAVFGNVGTMIAFRVGATDAEALEQEFAPVFVIEDLVNLGFAQIYLKLMIDGLSSTPFSATTLGPIPHPDVTYVKEIIDASREQFTRPRAEVEEAVIKFHEPTPKAPPAPKAPVAPATSVAAAPIASAAPVGAVPAPKAPEAPLSPKQVPPKPLIKAVTPPAPKPHVVQAAPPPPPKPRTPVVTPAVGDPDAPVPVVSASKTVPAPKPIEREERPDPVAASPVSAPVPKAIPLSTLNKSVKKADPKVRSPENVNELKNALAAVLGKAKAEAPKTESPKVKEPVQPVQSTQPKSEPNHETSNKVEEVPRDVLENILKVD
jgi:hypothetical protein